MTENHSGSYERETISKATRLLSIDALRGFIIVLMALDHANYMVALKHTSGEYWGGSFPMYYEVLAFINRFVTHVCAPGFFFLMGVGMLLFAESRRERGWSTWQTLQHFWLRGAFFIALQLLVVNRIWQMAPPSFPEIYVGVLVALGGTMILGSLFLRLKPVYLAVLTLVLFVGMELTHPDPSQWGLIFDQPLGLIFGYSGGKGGLWVTYPILPWLELVMFGMLFGHWVRRDSSVAYRRGAILGVIFLVAFVVLRYLDGFGNIQPRLGDSLIDYLNVVKYPPSMTFTLLTTGINLIVLWLFSRLSEWRQIVLEPLAAFGRAPMFSYLVHLLLYVAIGRLFAPDGTSIVMVYPFWLLGLVILLPLAWWYGRLRARQPANSLLRFL